MKRILILFAGLVFGTAVAQTEKTETLKKIDSVRGVQINGQREGATTLPVTTNVKGIPASPQPNAVETRTATTGSSVNPGTPNGNLPLQQGKQTTTTTTKASKNMRVVTPNIANPKTIDTISSETRRNRVRATR